MAAPARAQQRESDAKAAFQEGKAAYESQHFDVALERFKRSYVLSGQPALLYNIASTLQQLNRPGAAADALRDFIKARPNDPDRAELETRIATLDKAQQILDRDAQEQLRRAAEQAAAQRAAAASAGLFADADTQRRLELEHERERRRRRKLALGLGLGLGLAAVAAITIGTVCGTGHCGGGQAHDFDYAPATVTR
jgi:hypothetical protein